MTFVMKKFVPILLIFGLLILGSCNYKPESLICKIPFVMFKNQMIITLMSGNSDSLNFVFDTGNENAHIDSATAAKLKLKPFDFLHVHCSASDRNLPIVRCSYSVNGLILPDVINTVTTFKNYSRILKRRIDGIIGQDLYKNYTIKIDYKKKIIEVHTNDYIYKGKGHPFYIIDRGPAIIATAVLQNKKKIMGKFIIDTGSNSSLTLSSVYTDTLNMDALIGKNKVYRTHDGCGNAHTEYEGKAKDILIGDYMLSKVPVSLTVAEGGVLAEDIYAGFIGVPILSCYDIVISYRYRLVYFEPNEMFGSYASEH